ncbi:MAG TPA: ABC transporter permease [Vicinamibacteria bacterium]|nr:ABC transporter permease [Vicinamibacteria bacterium]
MLLYHLRIAFKSLRRSLGFSAVVVGGIALGIGVASLFATIRHALAKDPIPRKSGVLYNVRLDNWDPAKPHPNKAGIPPQVTFRDMTEIMKTDVPVHQSGMFKANLYVFPEPGAGRPTRTPIRLCFADFFPMFDAPFQYGSGWDRKADLGPEPVVVLGEEMNDKLFGGQDSVGKTVRIEDREFRVVGVLKPWRPSIKFYDITQQQLQAPEQVFMPMGWLRPMQIRTSGNSDGWKSPPQPGFEGVLVSETVWLQMWVELPDQAARQRYVDFLTAYVTEQKKQGRFPRPLRVEVTPLMALMDEQGVTPPELTAMVVVSLLFLAVCALNLTGLLLAKFLARAPEIGVRRALGASRKQVFLQHVVECELVGVLGGALGILLSLGAVAFANGWVKALFNRADLIQFDATMAGYALGLSLLAGLVAGVYPAWRVCRIPPAVHLKLQ